MLNVLCLKVVNAPETLASFAVGFTQLRNLRRRALRKSNEQQAFFNVRSCNELHNILILASDLSACLWMACAFILASSAVGFRQLRNLQRRALRKFNEQQALFNVRSCNELHDFFILASNVSACLWLGCAFILKKR
jgi:hypothetical protein